MVARGVSLMQGYWNREEETRAAFRDGWLSSGDMGYIDNDGFLFIVDRLKDMIVCGGENVYSAEVENALSRHPAVASCAVIGIPSERWGEQVHAVVVLNPEAGERSASNSRTLQAIHRRLQMPQSPRVPVRAPAAFGRRQAP